MLTKSIADKIPKIEFTSTPSLKPALIPVVTNPSLQYSQIRQYGRGSFQPCEYDLAEIGRIEDVESYVRQAFNKKVGLMFKEGYDIVGPNLKTINYIKIRLNQIARASNTPTKALTRAIGSGLVRKSNCFFIKVRKVEASGGKVRKLPGKETTLNPVAAYFVAPAETMEYRIDGTKIGKWRQVLPDGQYKEYDPEDVVHFYYDRKEGFVFGTPILVPIRDDIRALRKIEENVELLVYQHLFPLFQYKIGTENAPCGLTEEGEKEIDVVKREIQYMPSEGGIVTSERHEIKSIGAEGRALRAEAYLEHFKRRVISGLGISGVDLGEGDTVNRSTSETMSRNLVDSVKDYQEVMEALFDELIIKELLLESTFGDSVLDDENLCHLKFREIDLNAQIKKEAHYADQFTKNVITHDEARAMGCGLEPLTIPTPEEIDGGKDTPELFPAWHRTYWKLFEMPKLLIQAIDEQYVKQPQVNTKQGVSVSPGQPKKQGTSSGKPSRDGYLISTYHEMTNNIVDNISKSSFTVSKEYVIQLIRTSLGSTVQKLVLDQMSAFRKGFSATSNNEEELFKASSWARLTFNNRSNQFITKLSNDIANKIQTFSFESNREFAQHVRVVLDSYEYRSRFLEVTETKKAYNFGIVKAWRSVGITLVKGISVGPTCESCRAKNEQPIRIELLGMDNIIPYHPSCDCYYELIRQDSVSTHSDESNYKVIKYEKCLEKAKANFRMSHPDYDEEQIEYMAEITCAFIQNNLTELENMKL